MRLERECICIRFSLRLHQSRREYINPMFNHSSEQRFIIIHSISSKFATKMARTKLLPANDVANNEFNAHHHSVLAEAQHGHWQKGWYLFVLKQIGHGQRAWPRQYFPLSLCSTTINAFHCDCTHSIFGVVKCAYYVRNYNYRRKWVVDYDHYFNDLNDRQTIMSCDFRVCSWPLPIECSENSTRLIKFNAKINTTQNFSTA